VKASNLAGHYERVHPRAKPTLTKEDREAIRQEAVRARPSSHADWRIPAIAVLLVALAGRAVYAYTSVPAAAGRISVEPTVWDFGQIQQVVVSHNFEVRNLGSTPLRLDGISTSCMCTSAEFTDPSGTSPRFGLHGNPSWQHTIAPGARGVLTVFYDPMVHPERGPFQRDVYVLSSDPSQREVIVTIYATEV
jgi:hypothetical protein